MSIQQKRALRMSGLVACLIGAVAILVLVSGQEVAANKDGTPSAFNQPQPGDASDFLRDVATRRGNPQAFSCEVVQSEAGRADSPVTTATWHMEWRGDDFDATLNAEGREQRVSKRKDEFLYFTGASQYRFDADAWAKGYLQVPLWGRFDSELRGFPTDLGEDYRPVEATAQTAAVLHTGLDMVPTQLLISGSRVELGQAALAGGESCNPIRVVPGWKDSGAAGWHPLGLPPEVTCSFAASDGRLVGMDIAVSRLNSEGTAKAWIKVSTVVTQWGSGGNGRIPASIQTQIQDLQTGQQATLWNTITFGVASASALTAIPSEASDAVDLEPQDPSIYQQRRAKDPADLAARLALIRHQAFGANDTDGAKLEVGKLPAELGTASSPILTQAGELAYVLGADDVSVWCAEQALAKSEQSVAGAENTWTKRGRIIKGRALARSNKGQQGWTDALALVQSGRLSVEEMDQAGGHGLMRETDQPAEARLSLLSRQVQSLHTALNESVSARSHEAVYRRWRNTRLAYLDRLIDPWNEEVWPQADRYTAGGAAQGLAPFAVARECWRTSAERAGRAHARDAWDNDDPNRDCLKIYLKYLQSQEPDEAKAQAETARVQRLLDEPDPAVRAAATKEMRQVLGDDVKPHTWHESLPWTAQAVSQCTQMLQAATTEEDRREAVDCVMTTAWRADMDYAPPLVAGTSPSLESVWALREQLPTEADQKAMDGAKAVALARRGQTETAQQMVADLRQWLGTGQGTDAQRDRLNSLISDTEDVIKDVADKLSKGERVLPVTDVSAPVPASVWSKSEIRHRFARAAVSHYSAQAVGAQDLWEGRCAIEKAVGASFATADPPKSQAEIEQRIAGVGARASAEASTPAEEQESFHRRWRNLRLYYLDKLMGKTDNEEIWNRLGQFTANGVGQGLRPFEMARESWQAVAERAGRAHGRDTGQDDPNRDCLKIWLEYLQNQEPDQAKAQAEIARVQRLLDDPDPEVRAVATPQMRHIAGNDARPHTWHESVQWTDQAVSQCRQMLQSATTEEERREAVDCVMTTAWRADMDYAPPLVAGISPALESVWALREQLPTEADQKAMDGAKAVALARRGQTEAAQQMVADLRQWLSAAHVSGDQSNRVNSLIGDVERTVKDVAERQTKGERLSPITDVSVPVPAASWSEEEMCSHFRQAAINHFSIQAMVTKDSWEAKDSIEKAVNAALLGRDSQNGLAVADQLIAWLGSDAPAHKAAWARAMRMDALTWKSQFKEAVELGQSVGAQYLHSEDPAAVDAAADALCRSYLYSAMYLNDLEGGRKYLEVLRQAYPDGRYESLIGLFTDLVDRRLAYLAGNEKK